MKHSIRDILIFLVSTSGISWLYRRRARRNGPLVRVLCFHDVPDGAWFERVISMLTEEYNVITPKQFHRKEFDQKKINILLTFDDGYESWVTVALPVLQKHNIKALFFVVSGLLDVHGTEEQKNFVKKRLLLKPRVTLSWEGARELVVAGHAIGGHTVHHRKLARLSKKNEAKLREEIGNDKEALESKVNTKVEDFAYPFGRREHYNERVVERVKQARYQRAFIAETGFVQSDGFEIPRTLIEQNQPLPSIKRWIEGGYDIFSILK